MEGGANVLRTTCLGAIVLRDGEAAHYYFVAKNELNGTVMYCDDLGDS